MKRTICSIILVALLISSAALFGCGQADRDILSASINNKGELVLSYRDGKTENLGVVRGADGQNGQEGLDGMMGTPGTPGKEGKPGRGIESITLNEYGGLVITYDDGSTPTVLYLADRYCSVWVDMTEKLTLFADESLQTPAGEAVFGEELLCVGMGQNLSVISLNGTLVYAETKYLKDEGHNGSVVFVAPEHPTMRVTAGGINLRSYTDASSGDNIVTTLATDSVVTVTGVSKNGHWVRIAYTPVGESEAQTLYARLELDGNKYLEYIIEA